MKILFVLFLFNAGVVYAQNDGPSYDFNLQGKPKKKVIKKVTTYEEVDENGGEHGKRGEREESAKEVGVSAHLDLLAGMAVPVGKHVKSLESRLGYGGQILVDLTKEFSLGAYYLTNEGSVKEIKSIDVGFSYYGLVTQFKLSPIAYTQFKAGFSTMSISGGRTTLIADDNPFTASAGLGFELPISEMVSFAPYASYTHSFETDSTESFGMFDVMGALRFKF